MCLGCLGPWQGGGGFDRLKISSFPARKFYRNCLKDSSTVFEYKKIQTLRCFGPLILFDVSEGQEQSHLGKSSSWCNLDELRVLRLLLRSLICLYPNFNTNSFGIIGGYNGQIDEIKNYKLTERQLGNRKDHVCGHPTSTLLSIAIPQIATAKQICLKMIDVI